MKRKEQLQTVFLDKIITLVYEAQLSLALGEMCSISERHKIHLVCDTAA